MTEREDIARVINEYIDNNETSDEIAAAIEDKILAGMRDRLKAAEQVCHRHDWSPEMGQCVCTPHDTWRNLMTGDKP